MKSEAGKSFIRSKVRYVKERRKNKSLKNKLLKIFTMRFMDASDYE